MDRLNLRSKLLVVCILAVFCVPLSAQTHTSVPLDSEVYYILEQAVIKGLCTPLSGIKPYSRNVIVTAINEILGTENEKKLNATEREILEQYLGKFAKPKDGVDWQKGQLYHGETAVGKNDTPLSLNVGTGLDIEGSAGLYDSFNENYFGTEVWLRFYLNGDIGRNVSWEFAGEGGLMREPIKELGTYNTYYKGFGLDDDGNLVDPDREYQNQLITVYSGPLTHFPYTYKKRWDGSIYFIKDVYSFSSWPVEVAGAYNLISEIDFSFLEDKIFARLGRVPHEWGSTSHGSSLHLNQMARPFVGIEAEFRPFSWFSLASMTGILEYYNTEGIKSSAESFQNAYSTSMLQFRYKNYFFLDLGEAVVYPKRFELGYISPITNSIFYQNNIGDFDNMSATVNLKGQYPGVGNIWASLFWDEAFWVSNFNEVDGTMIALQAGTEISLPFLAFSSIKFSYTKINPYTYTHNRNYNPWYGDLRMETSYTNNGVGLGYYLPPNSVEYLVRFKTMPVKSLTTSLQYQLIQHGADFGNSAVDGSNLLSELDPDGRHGQNPISKRYFLHDGAYQWMHIIKAGAEWNLPTLPVALYGEAGVVISYFTDIAEKANVTGESHPYSRINTPEYPESTGFIVKIGVKVFPR